MLSGRGLCGELITRPEESYRLWCVVVCDLETSRMRSWPALSRSATEKKINIHTCFSTGVSSSGSYVTAPDTTRHDTIRHDTIRHDTQHKIHLDEIPLDQVRSRQMFVSTLRTDHKKLRT